MIVKLKEFIEKNRLFMPKDPILLAISGGIDSVIMGHLFRTLEFNFAIAHLNYQLRGYESVKDELFVKDLGDKWNVSFFVTHFDTNQYAADRKISIQMAGRELRYEWLEKIRKEQGFHFIATAHHQNDSIETVLLNVFRGTGVRGLHGILPKNGKVVRPMLPFYKHEIDTFASLHNIPFRQDISNFETDYDRNKIRIEIIPVIEKNFPSFLPSFSENISRWNDAGLIYEEQIRQFKKKLPVEQGEEVYISIPKILQSPAPKTVLFELLKDFGFTAEQVASVYASFDSIPGKMFYSDTHQLLKDRNQLIVSKKSSGNLTELLILESDRSINIPSLHLKISIHETGAFNIPRDSSISCLDHQCLEFPLVLRHWKKGDYFYPFGMKKKKKISDYLIDRKMPLHEKDKVWVLLSGDRIACIIGERIDERFKVEPNTKKVFVIKSV